MATRSASAFTVDKSAVISTVPSARATSNAMALSFPLLQLIHALAARLHEPSLVRYGPARRLRRTRQALAGSRKPGCERQRRHKAPRGLRQAQIDQVVPFQDSIKTSVGTAPPRPEYSPTALHARAETQDTP